jgi:hypothetical protein
LKGIAKVVQSLAQELKPSDKEELQGRYNGKVCKNKENKSEK